MFFNIINKYYSLVPFFIYNNYKNKNNDNKLYEFRFY